MTGNSGKTFIKLNNTKTVAFYKKVVDLTQGLFDIVNYTYTGFAIDMKVSSKKHVIV